MARIRKRRIRGRTYYLLEHSFRQGSRVKKREIFLGRHLPADVPSRIVDLGRSMLLDRWASALVLLRRGFQAELRRSGADVHERNREATLVRYVYESQRIEGSSLSHRETADLLTEGRSPGNRPIRDVREAEAHWTIIRSLVDGRPAISLRLLLRWHRELFRSSRPAIAGRLRDDLVFIRGSSYIPPSSLKVPGLLRELFAWNGRSRLQLHPVLRAGILHLRFEAIHPFADGNGRTGRLILNAVLQRAGFPIFSVDPKLRPRYLHALERSHAGGSEIPFLRWFLRAYVRSHQRYLLAVRRPAERRRPPGTSRGSR